MAQPATPRPAAGRGGCDKKSVVGADVISERANKKSEAGNSAIADGGGVKNLTGDTLSKNPWGEALLVKTPTSSPTGEE